MIGCDETQKRHSLAGAIARLKRRGAEREKLRRSAEKARRGLFRKARERLREGILQDFRHTEWPRFQRLHEVFEKGWGLPVPVLSVCGRGTAEIRFTQLLAWFLDHRNPHGLGGLLAQALFEEMFRGETVALDRCAAETEVFVGTSLGAGGIRKENWVDVHLQFARCHIYIEQKIGSPEGEDQLANYADCLAPVVDLARDRLVYLTPTGKEPSDSRWTALSYRELFGRLALVLDRHALSQTARYNLKALLWDLMLGPIAKDPAWIDMLRKLTARVVKNPDREYIPLSRRLAQYGLGPAERRIMLRIAEE